MAKKSFTVEDNFLTPKDKMKEKVLIYDIECKTVVAQPNPEKDEFRAFGCYQV